MSNITVTDIGDSARLDELTGLLNRVSFFAAADAMIKQRGAGYYILSSVDIDKFKVINDQYGMDIGDQVLRHIANALKAGVSELEGICCRYTADKFGVLYPASYKDSEVLRRLYAEAVSDGHIGRSIRIRVGRYLVDDLSVPVGAMFDRATMAEESIRGRYDVYIAEYQDSMRTRLLHEQEIVNDMDRALRDGEFEPWFQPQYNHATGAIIGAEALVRWRRGGKLIPPDEFVPVFERNGFIYELDQDIWEQVCALLRRWLDEGRSPLPVSVNISRMDLFRADFIRTITGLVKKYDIPISLLRLEVTESAFAEKTGHIVAKVGELIRLGFTVEIDDFGSGYSSLNTLKDVPASILKLDMKFFENTANQQRGGNIVESVVRMAKWLGMSVVAEGVEDKEQADYLKSIGCCYIQGYYYARPMPAAEYEALMDESAKEPKLTRLETLKTLDNNEFWNPKSMDTLIFNSYVGGACIFEYANGKTELLRVNEQYAGELGGLLPGETFVEEVSSAKYVDDESKGLFFKTIHTAIDSQREAACELRLTDSAVTPPHTEYVRMTLRVIARSDQRYLFYCVIVNTTRQHEAERRQMESARRLEVIIENINGGVVASYLHGGELCYAMANDRFFEVLGYSREQFEAEKPNVFSLIHPDDRQWVEAKFMAASQQQGKYSMEYRILRRDGSPRHIQCSTSVIRLPDVEEPVQLAVMNDVTELRSAQEKENRTAAKLSAVLNHAGNGIAAIALRPDAYDFLFANDRFFEIVGHTRRSYAQATAKDLLAPVHPADREELRRSITELNRSGGSLTVKYRVVRPDGQTVWVKNTVNITDLSGVDCPVQISTLADVTAETETAQQLRFLNDSAHGILAQPDSDIAVTGALDRLRDYFQGQRAYIVELDLAAHIGSSTYERCAPGAAARKDRQQKLPFSKDESWYVELRNHRYCVIDGAGGQCGAPPPTNGLLTCPDTGSLIVAPLKRDGTMMGFVAVECPSDALNRLDTMAALGDYIAILLTRRDLSARIHSDREMLTALMNDTPGGFVRMLMTSGGTFVPIYSNTGLQKLFRCSRERLLEIYGADALAGVHPEDKEIVRSAGERMIKEGLAQSARFRALSGSGEYIWLTLYGRMTKDTDGKVYLNVYYSDASKEAEEDRRRTEAASVQRELLDNLPSGAALYQYDGQSLSVIHINKSYWQLVGRPPVDYSAASVLGVIHPDDRDIVHQELDAAIRQKRRVDVNVRILCGESEYKPFRIIATVASAADGTYLLYASYFPINDDSVSVQEMLPIALSTVMSASEDLSFVKDRDLHYICCSQSVADTLGLESVREVIGKTDYELFSKKYADIFSRRSSSVIDSGRAIIGVRESVPVNGGMRMVETSSYPIMDASGSVIGVYGVCRDITDQHEKESQLELLASSIAGGLATYAIGGGSMKMLYFNDGFYKFSGLSREEYARNVDSDPLFFVFEEDKDELAGMIRSCTDMPDGHENSAVYRCHTLGGGYRWMSMRSVLSRPDAEHIILNVVQLDITEQQEEREKLRVSEELNRLAIEHSGRIITRFDVGSRTLTLPKSFNPIFVLPPVLENMPEEQISLGRVSPDTADVYRELFNGIIRGEPSGIATYKQNSTRGWRWLEAQYTTIFSDNGKPLSAVISFTDVTEELEKEIVYNKWQQSLSERPEESYTLFRCNLSKSASFDSREGKLLSIRFEEGADKSFDQRTAEYIRCVYEEDRETYLAFLDSDTLLASYYRGRRSHTLEYREVTAQGAVCWRRLSVDLVEYPGSKDVEAYLMFEDIDQQKKAELLTLERSETDPLTGVYNRTAFIDRMERQVRESGPGREHALLMLDIDNFKQINDTLGHGAGDRVLIELTSRIGAMLRHDDLMGRMGGDEFFVFLKDISRQAAAAKAGRICSMKLNEAELNTAVTASVGVAMLPEDGTDFDTLYKKVDAALYRQKQHGKNGYLFVSEDV